MTRRALKAYGQTALETEVDAANPHKLIAMLYDGALKAAAKAKLHMENGEIPEKCEAITRALAIIDRGLLASIDDDKGGELAANLRMMYEYLLQRLIVANARNDRAALEEVERLLSELSSAWSAIGPAS